MSAGKTWKMLAFALAFGVPSLAQAEQGWGKLRGKFVLKGTAPKLEEIDAGTDQVCCQAEPKNEQLVLGKNSEIANVVVYLRPGRGATVNVHPDYNQSEPEPAQITNKGCAFVPHVLLVRTGQEVILANDDPTNHSIKAELRDDAFNVMLGGKERLTITPKSPQRVPMPIACSIHPFMRGWILVRDTPYMAASDREGNFEIDLLPAGENEFQLWHEMPGYLSNAKSNSGVADRRGRITLVIPNDGVLDLGEIEIEAETLAE